MSVSRVRENRTHGSMRRREATPDQSAMPRGPGRLPPTLQVGPLEDLTIAAWPPLGRRLVRPSRGNRAPLRSDLASRRNRLVGLPHNKTCPMGLCATATVRSSSHARRSSDDCLHANRGSVRVACFGLVRVVLSGHVTRGLLVAESVDLATILLPIWSARRGLRTRLGPFVRISCAKSISSCCATRSPPPGAKR